MSSENEQVSHILDVICFRTGRLMEACFMSALPGIEKFCNRSPPGSATVSPGPDTTLGRSESAPTASFTNTGTLVAAVAPDCWSSEATAYSPTQTGRNRVRPNSSSTPWGGVSPLQIPTVLSIRGHALTGYLMWRAIGPGRRRQRQRGGRVLGIEVSSGVESEETSAQTALPHF